MIRYNRSCDQQEGEYDMTKEELIQAAQKMAAAPSCFPALKAAAEAWVKAVGTTDEAAAAKALKAQLDDCVTDVDDFIAFAGSPDGAKILGGEQAAAGAAEAAKASKAKGNKYCICDACQNGGVLLDHASDWL